ncbi:hypothetical protein MHBO_000842, partial [Bonamia ostreae]
MPKQIRALTYNIFTGKIKADENRIISQIQEIIKLDCDVICLQEAWDRKVIDLYKEFMAKQYDIITCNSNFNSEEHPTLLLGRGGFCQRVCEMLLPLLAISICIALVLVYFLNGRFKPTLLTLLLFNVVIFLSVIISVFGGSFLAWIWRCCKLPQHGFISGDILGLMILVRNGKNRDGVNVRYVEGSAYAEVFSNQAAKSVWKLFGFVERFFIVKGYLSVDVIVDQIRLGVTNIHLNTGTRNKLRMKQIKELFKKAIPANQPNILCGDTNAEAEQPEIQWISGRMVETYAVKRNTKNRRSSRGDGFTWHDQNPLTRQGFGKFFEKNLILFITKNKNGQILKI